MSRSDIWGTPYRGIGGAVRARVPRPSEEGARLSRAERSGGITVGCNDMTKVCARPKVPSILNNRCYYSRTAWCSISPPRRRRTRGRGIPTFCIVLGNADDSKLRLIAASPRGPTFRPNGRPANPLSARVRGHLPLFPRAQRMGSMGFAGPDGFGLFIGIVDRRVLL